MKRCIIGDSKHHMERNASGYVDLTFSEVLEHEVKKGKKSREDIDYNKMKKEIKEMLQKHGYILEGPISLIKKGNGRKRRIY